MPYRILPTHGRLMSRFKTFFPATIPFFLDLQTQCNKDSSHRRRSPSQKARLLEEQELPIFHLPRVIVKGQHFRLMQDIIPRVAEAFLADFRSDQAM